MPASMSDLAQQFEEPEPVGVVNESGREPLPWTSIFLMVTAAIICWGLSLLLPDVPPIAKAASLATWLNFGERILRGVLQAVGMLALAIAMSALFPQVGFVIERMVLRSRRSLFLTVTAIFSIVSSGLFNYIILDHMPHIQDEIAMAFQAKILASGRFYEATPSLPEFFDCEFIVADGPRWYGKYFIGQSLPLVPGVWLNAPWLVHPLLAGVAIWLTFLLGKNLFNEKVARVAVVLMAISPFRVSLFAMMLAHPVPLVMLAVFALATVKVVLDPGRTGWALVAGLAIGFAGNIRPLTALAMGAVIGLAALIAMPWRRFRWQTAAAFVFGAGVFAVVLFGYNKMLTGDPLLTPFNKWSQGDRLGFGPDIGLEYWRDEDKGHTLKKALFKDLYFNFDVLGQNLTGWGQVTLVLLFWPVVRSRWPKRTWALAAVIGSLVFVHIFHVSNGVLAGQARYWSESMPMMVLLVAIGLASVRALVPHVCRAVGLYPAVRTGRSACWLAAGLLTVWSIKIAHIPLIEQCKEQFWGQGPTIRELARRQKLDNALVFIESGHYSRHFRGGLIDMYPCGFMLNDPDLEGPVVYARDLGDDRNVELMRQYPGRSFYRVDPSEGADVQIVPISGPTRTSKTRG